MAVKKAVQCGNVEDAIEKVNDLNPEVDILIWNLLLILWHITFVFGDGNYEIITSAWLQESLHCSYHRAVLHTLNSQFIC
jgi:hypothetical protein